MKQKITGRTMTDLLHKEVVILFSCALILFVLMFGLPVAAQDAGAHYSKTKIGALSALLPDLHATPGVARPDATKEQICAKSFRTGVYRNTTAKMKAASYAEYGVKNTPGKYEVDHLISLQLGGADDPRNLWPEPYLPRPGAREKDVVEGYLHRQICSGQITLAEAQREITTNWLKVYAALPRKAAK